MSRALERAYDIIVRGDEVLSLESISQLRAENSTVPDMMAISDGTGGFRMISKSELGGVPVPPLGEYDALTCDPAGVVQWGGVVSAGEF